MNAARHLLTPARALLLAAALLLAQAAGLWHGVAHGGASRALPGAGHGVAHGADPQVAEVLPGLAPTAHAGAHAHAHAHAHAWAEPRAHGLHDHPQAGAECRLYDQLLGHADALLAAAPWPGVAAAGATATVLVATAAGSRLSAAYQARGPPRA